MKKRLLFLLLFIFISSQNIVSLADTNMNPNNENIYSRTLYSYDGVRVVTKRDSDNKELYGYTDEEGNVIAECVYDYAMDFVNGFGLVRKNIGKTSTGEQLFKYFAVNTKGETVIEFNPDLGQVKYYDGEHGIVSIDRNYALIDGNGNLTTPYAYDAIINIDDRHFANPNGIIKENALFVRQGDHHGFIDWNGNIVIPIDKTVWWNYLGYRDDDSRLYALFLNKTKGGYINTNAEIIVPFIYDHVSSFERGYAYVKKKGLYAFIDTSGNPICEFKYDDINLFQEGLAIVKKDGLFGAIDTEGNEVIPLKYYGMNASFNGVLEVLNQDGTSEKLDNPILKSRKVNLFLGDTLIATSHIHGTTPSYRGVFWLYTEQEPVIENGIILVPIRTWMSIETNSISSTISSAIEWNNTDKSVILRSSRDILTLKIGSREVIINKFDDGEPAYTFSLDAAPKIINGRTYVPLRFLAERAGAEVVWDQASRSVFIYQNNDDAPDLFSTD